MPYSKLPRAAYIDRETLIRASQPRRTTNWGLIIALTFDVAVWVVVIAVIALVS